MQYDGWPTTGFPAQNATMAHVRGVKSLSDDSSDTLLLVEGSTVSSERGGDSSVMHAANAIAQSTPSTTTVFGMSAPLFAMHTLARGNRG